MSDNSAPWQAIPASFQASALQQLASRLKLSHAVAPLWPTDTGPTPVLNPDPDPSRALIQAPTLPPLTITLTVISDLISVLQNERTLTESSNRNRNHIP